MPTHPTHPRRSCRGPETSAGSDVDGLPGTRIDVAHEPTGEDSRLSPHPHPGGGEGIQPDQAGLTRPRTLQRGGEKDEHSRDSIQRRPPPSCVRAEMGGRSRGPERQFFQRIATKPPPPALWGLCGARPPVPVTPIARPPGRRRRGAFIMHGTGYDGSPGDTMPSLSKWRVLA